MAKFGDIFIWSVLGEYGKGKFLKDIKPAMYRVHGGGIFSKKNNNKKLEMALLTNNALFSYYTRIGNKQLAKHFLENMVKLSIRSVGLLKTMYMFIRSKIKNNVMCIFIAKK